MSESLTRFKVNLWNFGAKGVIIKASAKEGEDDKSKAKLYFKLDFDKGHTQLDSKPVREKDDAVAWGTSKAFEYVTKHGDKLERKSLRIACWRSILLFPDKEVGSAQVDLHTLATGPSRLDLVLRDEDSNPVGHIYFEATMSQFVERAVVTLANVKLRMDAGSTPVEPGAKLSLCYGRMPYIKVETREHANACTSEEETTWSDLPILPLQECSCHDISRESIFLTVSRKKQVVGTAEIPIGPLFEVRSLQGRSFEALVLVPDGSKQVATITGTIAFRDTPWLAQLVGGVLSEAGIVEATDLFPSHGPVRLMVRGAEKPKSLATADVPLQDFAHADLGDQSEEQQEQVQDQEQDQVQEEKKETAEAVKSSRSTGSSVFSPGHIQRLMLAKNKFKSLMTPPSEDTRPEALVQASLESDEIRELVQKLQDQHKVGLAGLQLSFETQRERQRQRLEQRKKQRKNMPKMDAPLAPQASAPLAESGATPVSTANYSVALAPTSAAQDLGKSNAGESPSMPPASSPQVQVQLSKALEDLLRDAERSMFQDLDAKPPPTAMVNPARSEKPLPARWERRFDAQGNSYFTFPRERDGTVFTTWEDPRLVPVDWEMRVDQEACTIIFFHEPTGMSVFHDPRGLPAGWICFPDLDTKALTFMCDGAVTDQDPRGLPPGWRAEIDKSKGNLLFFHEAVTGLDPTADPRKLNGVTEELRQVWRQTQFLEWIDLRSADQSQGAQRDLLQNIEAAETAFVAWQDAQYGIVSAQFEALQLNLLSLDPVPTDQESNEVMRRFKVREEALLQGWRAEREKIRAAVQQATMST
ncbi:NEDD4-like E3 ubiquitin-protein ligase WWP1 [Hondaea fermentalgiana]|uniref:NEDD4-like E3 ubiquitin-protein ligase WWP1 n=1 Tax=Hondaea fermentalgiana TaxID=2315210 RepID=A0A2R5GT45_9STRA|nr:NEDD4-like E3 ubiquitin-protein ligase WWP1 [Hondaea fermentalgiana]|eukprot:GBG34010.1 NEDD4-like E3 ubiquitin-protein ligase WWP1 [Hondaea fermentalgiana]